MAYVKPTPGEIRCRSHYVRYIKQFVYIYSIFDGIRWHQIVGDTNYHEMAIKALNDWEITLILVSSVYRDYIIRDGVMTHDNKLVDPVYALNTKFVCAIQSRRK